MWDLCVNRYPQMSKALMKTGRPIYFSLCEWYRRFSTCSISESPFSVPVHDMCGY